MSPTTPSQFVRISEICLWKFTASMRVGLAVSFFRVSVTSYNECSSRAIAARSPGAFRIYSIRLCIEYAAFDIVATSATHEAVMDSGSIL